VIAGILLLANGALAQPPQEVLPPAQEDIIQLQPGRSRTFRFDKPVRSIRTPDENMVEITPKDETTFVFKGLGTGETVVTARGEDGKVIHEMRVVVAVGNVVKVYGLSEEPDFVGFTCDQSGCGHGESGAPKPSSTTVRKPLRGGGFIERNYQ